MFPIPSLLTGAKERPVNNAIAGCPVRPSWAVEINPKMMCAFYFEVFIQCQLAAFPVNIHNQHPGFIIACHNQPTVKLKPKQSHVKEQSVE